MAEQGPIFKDLSAEDPSQGPTEIESLCVNCGQNGITKLLLTKIPHYKEVILMSFNCEGCSFQNNEIQSGGMIQEQGIKYKVKMQNENDLSRQIVKSDYATLTVPEIDLEIPADSQKGAISTVEGVLQRTIGGLQQDQPVRRHLDPDGAQQIDDFVQKIQDLLNLKQPFHVIVTDPSGNSFVENPHAPRSDPAREVSHFLRSREQDHALGLYTQEELGNGGASAVAAEATTSSTGESSTTSSSLLLRCQEGEVEDDEEKAEATGMVSLPRVLSASVSHKEQHHQQQSSSSSDPLTAEKLKDEVLTFHTNCPECNAPANTNMKVTSIPHFKEVVIMATVCDYCGHKTNEVKSGGGIEPKGKRITLNVTDSSDMSRDVLKSETCSVLIPELDFEMGGHALGGRFTTLEGLLNNVVDQLENNPLLGATSFVGDSATKENSAKMDKFKESLNQMIECKRPFTVILDDPAGNSYIQNTYAPDPDPEMKVDLYERTFEQNDDLGINDMKVENYHQGDENKSLEDPPQS